MSYSFRATAAAGVITEWDETPQHGYGDEQSKDDLNLIRELVQRMAATMGGECIIGGGGHANPMRKPEGSWATDHMSINITRLQPVSAPQPVEAEPEPQPVVEDVAPADADVAPADDVDQVATEPVKAAASKRTAPAKVAKKAAKATSSRAPSKKKA